MGRGRGQNAATGWGIPGNVGGNGTEVELLYFMGRHQFLPLQLLSSDCSAAFGCFGQIVTVGLPEILSWRSRSTAAPPSRRVT